MISNSSKVAASRTVDAVAVECPDHGFAKAAPLRSRLYDRSRHVYKKVMSPDLQIKLPETVVSMSSPNHDARAHDEIDTIILHYTGMRSGAAAIARLCDPASKVSSHYVIHEDGGIVQLVAERRRAWHAGVSRWQDATDINSRFDRYRDRQSRSL